MATLRGVYFLPMLGVVPENVTLDEISSPEAMSAHIFSLFSGLSESEGVTVDWRNLDRTNIDNSGLNILYIYGHGWIDDLTKRLFVAVADDNSTLDAWYFTEKILKIFNPDNLIVFFDSCHAECFDAYFSEFNVPIRLAVYSCAENESSVALVRDGVTRFASELGKRLKKSPDTIELVSVVYQVKTMLENDSVIKGQSVSYRMHGRELSLGSYSRRYEVNRESRQNKIRTLLFTFGAVSFFLLMVIYFYLSSNTYIEIDTSGIKSISRAARIYVYSYNPKENSQELVKTVNVSSNRIKFWVPRGDIGIKVSAEYEDGLQRRINFHLNNEQEPFSIYKELNIPSGQEIISHPGMAYIQKTSWLQGEEKALVNSASFWVDIRPPRTDEYSQLAIQYNKNRYLSANNSIVLTSFLEAGEDIVLVYEYSTQVLESVHAGVAPKLADTVLEVQNALCLDCPAVMTYFEATLYCRMRGMSLPTPEEWEVAVRGIDGRRYPWGDSFDEDRANAPGLPDKNEIISLLPIAKYETFESPFGLVDTVGNASDWVYTEYGSVRIHMGGSFQMNPEDALPWFAMPDRSENIMLKQNITARCADTSLIDPL